MEYLEYPFAVLPVSHPHFISSRAYEMLLIVPLRMSILTGEDLLIAGAGADSTQEAIELTKHAYKAGANYGLVVTPYYNKPTQEGLYQHL